MPFSPPSKIARFASRPDTLLSEHRLALPCMWPGAPCTTRPKWITTATGPELRFCYSHGTAFLTRVERDEQGQAA